MEPRTDTFITDFSDLGSLIFIEDVPVNMFLQPIQVTYERWHWGERVQREITKAKSKPQIPKTLYLANKKDAVIVAGDPQIRSIWGNQRNIAFVDGVSEGGFGRKVKWYVVIHHSPARHLKFSRTTPVYDLLVRSLVATLRIGMVFRPDYSISQKSWQVAIKYLAKNKSLRQRPSPTLVPH